MENSERLKFERRLKKCGFSFIRQTGDHKIYKNEKGLVASVPMNLHKNTANKIAKDCNLDWHK